MPSARVLHNPSAGAEDLSSEELISLLEKAGYQCRISSTKTVSPDDFDLSDDIIVVGGGDGTVREIVRHLIDHPEPEKQWPIALLPMGTANNIAKTLQIPHDVPEAINAWKHGGIVPYDVGLIDKIGEHDFFLESVGFGLFPQLMHKMDKRKDPDNEQPDEKIRAALEMLLELCRKYEAEECKLFLDGYDFSGRYILVEVMNTKSIGPNLFLAPEAHPGDGRFDVVLVTEENRHELVKYIESKIAGEPIDFSFTCQHARDILMNWRGPHIHIDDQVVDLPANASMRVQLNHQLLHFLTGKGSSVR
jgi:diacylglycerol kinase (ATP)